MRSATIAIIGLFFFTAAQLGRPDRVASAAGRANAGPISHVVYIIQRDRSFNNLFLGFPGASTQNYGYDTLGTKIPLHAQSIATNWDIDHSSTAFFTAYDGKARG